MDRLDALKVFCAVVDTGGFSRAAAKLGISTSSVTHQIGQLEAHFGVKLLSRTTRSMSLTDEGRRCIEQARRLLDEMDDLESGMSGSLHEPRGSLRVDMHGRSEHPDDLSRLPCLNFVYPKARQVRPWAFQQDGQPFTTTPRGAVAMDHVDSLIEMAVRGGGIVQHLSVSLVQPLRSGALLPLLEPWQAAGPDVSVLYPQRHQRAAKIKVFVDFVEELFRSAAASCRPSA